MEGVQQTPWFVEYDLGRLGGIRLCDRFLGLPARTSIASYEFVCFIYRVLPVAPHELYLILGIRRPESNRFRFQILTLLELSDLTP